MIEEGMLSFALLGAGWVLYLLVGLSVLCVAVSIERAVYLSRDGTDPVTLNRSVQEFLAHGDAKQLHQSLEKAGGLEARILSTGLAMAPHGIDAAEKGMTSTATAEKMKMERGLSILATVGSNAPFLGLFGTVLGIIQAFNDLAENTAEASEAVMAGISEALVATAIGLLVAIPAVVLYNGFSRWVKGRLGRSESLADLVLARMHG